MAKFSIEEIGKKVAEEALDGYIYKGKTLREWIDILAQAQWIPISERLPEDSGEYLVSVIDDLYENGDYKETGIGWFAHKKDYSIVQSEWRELGIGERVVAWMPLPQPYKGESEGAE